MFCSHLPERARNSGRIACAYTCLPPAPHVAYEWHNLGPLINFTRAAKCACRFFSQRPQSSTTSKNCPPYSSIFHARPQYYKYSTLLHNTPQYSTICHNPSQYACSGGGGTQSAQGDPGLQLRHAKRNELCFGLSKRNLAGSATTPSPSPPPRFTPPGSRPDRGIRVGAERGVEGFMFSFFVGVGVRPC